MGATGQTSRAASARAVARPDVPAGPYLVLGLGRAGRAAATALAARFGPGAVRAWDGAVTPATLQAHAELRALGVDVRLGSALPPAVPPPGTVVRSPGIALDHPVIAASLAPGAALIDELELGWRLTAARVVGVTGTNGKGTVSTLVTQALAAAGERATTTGNWEFAAPLSSVRADASSWLVCEVSSYQLEGATAFLPDVAVLTNLAHDHLDRHGTMARYGAAKRRMFLRGTRAVPAAVVGIGDAFGRDLAEQLEAAGALVATVGTDAGASHRIRGCEWTLQDGRVALDTPSGPVDLRCRLPGRHNARNVATALAVADVLGVDREAALGAIAVGRAAPGRLEAVDAGQPFDALVDYAHNPAAYRAALETVRAVVDTRPGARLITVISVATNKDRTKRPLMAGIARRLADLTIVTRGNRDGPEPLEQAMADLMRAVKPGDGEVVELVPDRRAAIERAVSHARPGDAVLLLGRGAGTRALDPGGPPFDDRAVLRDAMTAA